MNAHVFDTDKKQIVLSYTVLVYDLHLRQGATSDQVLKLLGIYVVCQHLDYGPTSDQRNKQFAMGELFYLWCLYLSFSDMF